MARRDRANIRTDLWADADWRSLTHGAQWLYQLVLTSPTLNLCGVADWRPGRIAAMAADASVADVEAWAAELVQTYFFVIDESTEEVLIRSFFRHDGILAQPNPMTGAAREFAGVASALLRGVIAHELGRLRSEFPHGVGKANVWEKVPALRTILKTPPVDVRNPSENPSGNPSENPSGNPSPNPSRTSTSTSTELRSAGRARETHIPKDWAPTAEHYAKARERGVDIVAEAERFRLHAEAHDRRAVRWNAAFSMWLSKAQPTPGAAPARPVKVFKAHVD